MAKDLSMVFACLHNPQAYDADVCCDCTHDMECYERFLKSMEYFKEGKPVNDAFGKMH